MNLIITGFHGTALYKPTDYTYAIIIGSKSLLNQVYPLNKTVYKNLYSDEIHNKLNTQIKYRDTNLRPYVFPFDENFYGKKNNYWVFIKQYAFNDGDPEILKKYYPEKTPFDIDIAKEMLKDFNKYMNISDTLLIHCTYGYHRSPATAMAFNDIFKLGYNTDDFKKKYPEYRKNVYKIIIDASKSLKGFLKLYTPKLIQID